MLLQLTTPAPGDQALAMDKDTLTKQTPAHTIYVGPCPAIRATPGVCLTGGDSILSQK